MPQLYERAVTAKAYLNPVRPVAEATHMGDAKTLALIAWLGGWIAGPLPAIVTSLISPDLRGTWHYKKIVHAAIFWTVLIVVWGTVIVVDIGFRSGPTQLFFVGWLVMVMTAVLGTGFSVSQLLRRQPRDRLRVGEQQGE